MGLAALPSLSFFLPFFFLSLFLLSIDGEPSKPLCSPFNCGNITNISFPFADISNPRCGLILIECVDNIVARIPILGSGGYWVKNISNSSHSFTVQDFQLTWRLNAKRCNLISEFAPPISPNLPLKFSNPILKIFICNSTQHLNLSRYPSLRSYNSCSSSILYFRRPGHEPQQDQMLDSALSICQSVSYPLLQIPNDSEWGSFNFTSLVINGFPLHWELNKDCVDCQNSGGQCGLDSWSNFSCYCKDGNYGKYCTSGKPRTWLVRTIDITIAVGTIVLAVLFLLVLRWILKKPKCSIDFENVLKNYGNQMPKRYSYSDIRRMTNFMKCKLGEGGYGSVFKGQLLDGSPVAVKILTDAKGKGDDFINEVATIGRTAHVNIVRLMGFCSEGLRRALIYEFMPNGSLEKFIFAENPKEGPLGWEKLFKIALGIARGLEYLHRGCNTRILHFDIKPHNILLDQDFCPKISDFGLAKLCPDNKSIVSMTGTRGTVGYIAPELVSRIFGMVSNKSDVYSYGMLILEMVGGRKNVDARVDKTSEIYFPDWIYNRLDEHSDLQLGEITTHTEDEIARKMIIVGLWCIQTKPANRPTMSKVLEMLEGNIQGLQIPPKPYFATPSESENTISTNC